jgi:uncharacterized protein (UPF0332 family)
MDLKLYLDKSENELELAKIIFQITNNKKLQEKEFNTNQPLTFYSAVITHSYYCIFYAAKAYLLKHNIKTDVPNEHKKTYDEIKKLVDLGIVDLELLKMYEKIMVKADTLIGIFKLEKKKRGQFTYQKLPEANKEPSMESLNNAKLFFKNIYGLCNS